MRYIEKAQERASNEEVVPLENHGSDGELIGEEIRKSPPFPPYLDAVYPAAEDQEKPGHQEAFKNVGKMKNPVEVEVDSPVVCCLVGDVTAAFRS